MTEVGVQLVHYIEGLMAPRFGAMGSSARFLQMVEGPLPECTADDRAGIVHHHVADAAAGVGELVGHDVETVRLDLKHAIEATRRVRACVTRDGLLSVGVAGALLRGEPVDRT